MKVRILPEADEEGLAAADWYDERRPSLGTAFLAELRTVQITIRSRPQSVAKLEDYTGPHEIRRVLLKRFPYAVIFACREDEVVVVAIAHTHRKPLYWQDRLD